MVDYFCLCKILQERLVSEGENRMFFDHNKTANLNITKIEGRFTLASRNVLFSLFF